VLYWLRPVFVERIHRLVGALWDDGRMFVSEVVHATASRAARTLPINSCVLLAYKMSIRGSFSTYFACSILAVLLPPDCWAIWPSTLLISAASDRCEIWSSKCLNLVSELQ